MEKNKDYHLNQFNLDQFADFASDVDTLVEAEELVSKPQVSMIYSLFGELNTDKHEFGIEKISKLKRGEASELIEQLLQMKEEKEQDEFDEDYYDYYGEIGEDLDF